MLHDELLAKIEEKIDNVESISGIKATPWRSLRAVVELHKPIDNPNFPDSDIWCWQCADGRGYAKYPCPTIQVIEKQIRDTYR